MSGSVARAACRLGLAAGALFHTAAPARAQVVPPPASDIPVPPAPPPDSIRPDTIKAPVGRAPAPRPPATGPRYVWEGDEIPASGAYTLTDLLQRVPEVTTFRSGWIHSPQYAAVAGDVRRIRLFLDDVELDAIDPRELGFHELGRRPIWSLQRIAIERVGTEVRVDMRTWSVQRTTPFTRTDVYTGTEETDLYRGYYGKRFGNGAVLQFAGEQGSTENRRFGGGGDAASLLARVGIGRARWSLDAFAERRGHNRAAQVGEGVTLPPYDASHTFAYVRAAAGGAVSGPFFELLASTQGTRESTAHSAADTVDTAASRPQYVATAGYRTGALMLSATERIRRLDRRSEAVFSLRGEFVTTVLEVSARGETGGGRRAADGTVRLQPLRFVSLLASGSRRSSDQPGELSTATSLRLEAGLSLTGVWLYGGTLFVDAQPTGRHPLDFAVSVTPATVALPARRTARYVGLRGTGWRGLGADSYVIGWDDPTQYTPRYEARTEVNFHTRWLTRFPRGQFEFRIAVADEFRSGVQFAAERVNASHVLWGLMEIRIQRATLSLQVRNPLGRQYFLVPGFEMPRGVSTYGVRWYFWG